MKYQKIVVTKFGGPEVLRVVKADLPEPNANEVRVKVQASGVAFGDLMWMSGKLPIGPKPPFTPGYDIVGMVDKLGQGVEKSMLGQTVAALISFGGYSEYVCVPVKYLVSVPNDLDPAEVVCLTLNYITGYQIYQRLAKLKKGQRVLIHAAAGGVGTAMLQLGKIMGFEMYGTASKRKCDLVSKLGAIPIDYQNEDFVKKIFQLTKVGVDLVVDPIGGEHFKRSFTVLRPGGFLAATSMLNALYGHSNRLNILLGVVQVLLWNLLPNQKRTQYIDIPGMNKKHPDWYQKDLTILMQYLKQGKIKPVIAKRLPLTHARQAQDLILNSKIKGKVILES